MIRGNNVESALGRPPGVKSAIYKQVIIIIKPAHNKQVHCVHGTAQIYIIELLC